MELDKEHIALTFEEHFSLYGWESTTLDSVARSLKTSKQTIYRHLNPDSLGYDVDLAHFKERLAERRCDGVDAEQLFEERVKSSLREYLHRRSASAYESALETGFERRDDCYERLLYLVHGVLTAARQMPKPSSGFGRIMHDLPKTVRKLLADVPLPEHANHDEIARRITDLLSWSAELPRAEELDMASIGRLQDEVSEGVLQELGLQPTVEAEAAEG